MRNLKLWAAAAAALILAAFVALPNPAPVEASGGTCGVPVPVTPATLTLGSLQHSGQSGQRSALTPTALAGYSLVDSRTEVRWLLDDTNFANVVANLATQGISSNGTVVEAILFTESASPATSTVVYSDVVGASLFVRKWGNYHHRHFRPDGVGGFVEDVYFQDELSGSFDYHDLWLLGGTTTSSVQSDLTAYRFEWDNASRWDWLVMEPSDPDVGISATAHTNASSIPEIIGSGEMDPAGWDSDPCHSHASCANLPQTKWSPSCDITVPKCNPKKNKQEPTCVSSDLHLQGQLPTLTIADVTTMYALRDHLLSYPALEKYPAAYYGLVMLTPDDLTNATAAHGHALTAAYTVMSGAPTDVVIPAAAHTAYDAYLTELIGQNAGMDVILLDVQAKIDTHAGQDRSAFCAAVFGASDCGL